MKPIVLLATAAVIVLGCFALSLWINLNGPVLFTLATSLLTLLTLARDYRQRPQFAVRRGPGLRLTAVRRQTA